MAYDPKNPKVEVKSLERRHPPKGITSDIPDEVRERLMEERRQAEMAKGEKNRYAKGGVTRADGCARKGHTKGRMV